MASSSLSPAAIEDVKDTENWMKMNNKAFYDKEILAVAII